MGLDVAIVGATGAVGEVLLSLLEGGPLPVAHLRVLASARSAGRKLVFRGEEIPVRPVGADSFAGADLVFFSAGAERSRELAPAAVRAGAVVVDNSSAFRMDPGVPLVVPEINPGALAGHAGIVANPNCTTAVALMAVAPLHRAAGATALRAASYQAVSGVGARGMRELREQTADLVAGRPLRAEVFPHPIAMNVIPHCGGFLPGGDTEEERKLRDESRKILEAPSLAVSATCVRVPVLRAHSVACWLETERTLSAAEAREILAAAPGVMVVDDPGGNFYPMPVAAAGENRVQVGRIRADESARSGVAFFAVGDQLLKGAALNAVQIALALVDGDGLRGASGPRIKGA